MLVICLFARCLTLMFQEAKNAFKNLLETANIASDWIWDQAMRVIIKDRRYTALRTLAERKQAFSEVVFSFYSVMAFLYLHHFKCLPPVLGTVCLMYLYFGLLVYSTKEKTGSRREAP